MRIGKKRLQQIKNYIQEGKRTMTKEMTKEDVVKFIEGMTVLELSELVKELEQKFGVSAAAPVAIAAAAGPVPSTSSSGTGCPISSCRPWSSAAR